MTEQTKPNIKNYTPATGLGVDSEDQIFDLKTLMTSGNIVLTAAPAPEDDPSIVGAATTPKIANRTPFTGLFIDYLNNIIDFKTLLTSGLIKVQLTGTIIAAGPIDTQGYPIINSQGPAVTIDASILKIQSKISGADTSTYIEFDGTTEMDFSVGGEIPFSLTPTQLYSWVLSEFNAGAIFNDTVIFTGLNNTFTKATIFDDNVTINVNGGGTNTFNVHPLTYFNAAVNFNNAINLNGAVSEIRAAATTSVIISNTDTSKPIELHADVIEIDQALARHSQATNNITFGNATQIFNIGGTPILSISASELLAGANVNMNGYQIVSPSGQNIRLTPGGALDYIELWADTVNVKKAFIFNSTPTDNITYNSSIRTLFFHLNNIATLTLSDAGLKLSNGATINNIDNSGTSFSQTDGVTAYSVQQMIAAAIDAGVSFRDVWDASGGTFPTTGGTGVGGAIEKGNWWYISVAGTLSGQDVSPGDWITAIVNTPGQTGSNWLISYQGVTNVFGRLGPIVATYGDYSFSLISGNIATAQLPNSGVNGASQLVQLNSSTQLPAVSGVNLTGLTGSLTSSANNISVTVNGGAPSSNVNIINTNVLSVSGTDISSTINGVTSNNISVGFSNLTGTIDVTQLPNGGVNGASELVQLNASTQLPAVSGALLTGLTGSLSSSANNLNVSVNGGTASSNVSIVNSISLSSSTNSLTSTVNGVSSSAANIINSNSLTSSTNSLTSTINGVASSPANIVNSISLSYSSNQLTATVNGQSSNAVTIAAAMTFNTVTGSTQAMSVNNSYYSTYAGTCVMTLPSSAAAGSEVEAITDASHVVKIAQNAGQMIYYGSLNGVSQVTTTGTGGYLITTEPNTIVRLKCVVTDTTWVVTNMINPVTGA